MPRQLHGQGGAEERWYLDRHSGGKERPHRRQFRHRRPGGNVCLWRGRMNERSAVMNRINVPALMGLAILVAASQAAMAQTTTLVCQRAAPSPYVDDGTTTVDLNEAQNSVTLHFSAYHLIQPATSLPARLVGPEPAVFGADTITFSDPMPGFGSYVLNRL